MSLPFAVSPNSPATRCAGLPRHTVLANKLIPSRRPRLAQATAHEHSDRLRRRRVGGPTGRRASRDPAALHSSQTSILTLHRQSGKPLRWPRYGGPAARCLRSSAAAPLHCVLCFLALIFFPLAVSCRRARQENRLCHRRWNPFPPVAMFTRKVAETPPLPLPAVPCRGGARRSMRIGLLACDSLLLDGWRVAWRALAFALHYSFPYPALTGGRQPSSRDPPCGQRICHPPRRDGGRPVIARWPQPVFLCERALASVLGLNRPRRAIKRELYCRPPVPASHDILANSSMRNLHGIGGGGDALCLRDCPAFVEGCARRG